MKVNLKKAFDLLNSSQRRELSVLLLWMLIVALLETIGIGLLLPYVGIVSSPSLITSNRYLHYLYLQLGFATPQSFILAGSALLIVVVVMKNGVYMLQQYIQSRTLLKLQIDIESRLMASYLNREYLFFTEKNPTELYQNIRSVSGIVALVYTPMLAIATELCVLLTIGIFLIFVQPLVTLLAVVVSGILAYLIYSVNRQRAVRYGEEGTRNLIAMDKWMYQSFEGIKEIKVLSKEDFFLINSISYSERAVWAAMKSSMLSAATRPCIETVWFGLTVLLVLFSVLADNGNVAILPVIVLLAAAAIRIMPALNRIVNATMSVRQATHHVATVSLELGRMKAGSLHNASRGEPLKVREFQRSIRFEDVAFAYPGAMESVLRSLSFSINKGESVAFVGPSGAGKTTTIDLLLSLLDVQSGKILVDGEPLLNEAARSWRQNFGYVPQNIYLFDDSIRNNIAFGQPNEVIDHSRIDVVVKQAQLAELLERLPEGLDTIVGDRGTRLSGGQRQRIGIARALYRDPPILVLDEATSALDNETEREITDAIRSLSGSKTVILIAHRLSTVAHCDQIVFLVNGVVRAYGSYKSLMQDCEEFHRFATAGADF